VPILYLIPLPFLCLLILFPCLVIGLGGAWIVRRLGWMAAQEDNDAIVLTHAFAGMLYAVALGLMVVNVQSDYSEVKLVVMQEANMAEDLFMDSQGLAGAERIEIQNLMRSYLSAVIAEWPDIGDNKDSELPSHEYLEGLTSTLLNYMPENDKDLVIYAEMFSVLNGMLDLRRERLHLGREGVGPVTWLVVAVGALITIGMTWFYRTNSARTQYALVGVMSVMFGMMIFLIVAMDHPILGTFSVDSTPFEESRLDIEVWEQNLRQ
jgi:hypothetical protein